MEIRRATVIQPARYTRQALEQHRQENAVHEDQRTPKMKFAERLVHMFAGRLWKPVVDAGKQCEERSGRDHVMEMADYVICVMQVNIRARQTERQARQAADAEHR